MSLLRRLFGGGSEVGGGSDREMASLAALLATEIRLYNRDAVESLAGAAQLPDELVDEIALVGPKAAIQARAQKWLAQGEYIKTMICSVRQPEALPVLKEAFGI